MNVTPRICEKICHNDRPKGGFCGHTRNNMFFQLDHSYYGCVKGNGRCMYEFLDGEF